MTTKIKFFVYIPGDESVGILDFNAIVTIEDDGIYDTQELMVDLKESVKNLYDSNAVVHTELENLHQQLKYATMELDVLLNGLEEMSTDIHEKDVKLEASMRTHARNYRKNIANLKRKITKLKNQYDKMRVWQPVYKTTWP